MAAAISSASKPIKLKWGILGCANIAKKNARAIALSENGQLIAVASRDLDRCKKWAEEFSCEDMNNLTCYGSYDELLEDPNVEAIYMPLPTKLHKLWVCKAAAAKKHILVEKPAGIDLEDLKSMIKACEDNNVMFMDGVMFMHHERFQRMMFELYQDPAKLWGNVGRVTASFTFLADESFITGGNIRTSADGDPLGCLGDLGLYCIRYGLFAFQWKSPKKCKAIKIRRNADGVPIDVSAEVYWETYPKNISAVEPEPTLSFHCSFLHAFKQTVEVTGQSRRLTCDDFVVSEPEGASFVIHRDMGGLADVSTRLCNLSTLVQTRPFVQEANMFNNFAKCLSQLDSSSSSSVASSVMLNDDTLMYQPLNPKFWSAVSMQTQIIIDSVLLSDSQGGITVDVPPIGPELL